MRVAIATFLLALLACSAQASQCTGASAGVRTGRSFQLYSGMTPQVYRICKGEPVRGGDCDAEIRTESETPVAVLEKQPLNTCACTDVEGRKIVVTPITGSGQSCSGVSTTIWFENLSTGIRR